MSEYLQLFVMLSFFYWPIYLIVGAVLMFLVFRFWGRKSIISKILLGLVFLIAGFVLLPALYVVVMIIYGEIFNL